VVEWHHLPVTGKQVLDADIVLELREGGATACRQLPADAVRVAGMSAQRG
jgi:hypothetical protein